jgi:hypothetical protein
MSLNDIKTKLRKLLDKQKSAEELGNIQEAETFATKVQELLIKYELELSDIERHTVRSVNIDEEIIDCNPMTIRNESDWVRRLFGACAAGNFCKVLFMQKDQYKVFLIGEEINREVTIFLVHQLVPKLRHLARRSYGDYHRMNPYGDKRNTFIRSFLRGATISIKGRLMDELKAQEENTEQVHGLVLRKDEQLSRWMKEKYPVLGQMKSRNLGSHAGFHNGYEAGKNVQISKTGMGQGRTRGQIQ